MTQAFNLSQLANKVNTSGQLDVSTGVTGTMSATNLPTVPAAKGGTGLTSSGASGNVLTSDGTTWVSQAVAGGYGGYQIFASPGIWTVPTGVTQCQVILMGGGGGGGSGMYYNGTVGGGGGSAGFTVSYFSGLSAGATVPVTAGASGASNGGAGGTSSFGPTGSPARTVSATGGSGGSNGGATGGAGGTGQEYGIISNALGSGTSGTPSGKGGNGGASTNLWGMVGGTGAPTSGAIAGTKGGGGGGGGNAGNGFWAGAVGGAGFVIVQW